MQILSTLVIVNIIVNTNLHVKKNIAAIYSFKASKESISTDTSAVIQKSSLNRNIVYKIQNEKAESIDPAFFIFYIFFSKTRKVKGS